MPKACVGFNSDDVGNSIILGIEDNLRQLGVEIAKNSEWNNLNVYDICFVPVEASKSAFKHACFEVYEELNADVVYVTKHRGELYVIKEAILDSPEGDFTCSTINGNWLEPLKPFLQSRNMIPIVYDEGVRGRRLDIGENVIQSQGNNFMLPPQELCDEINRDAQFLKLFILKSIL